MASLLYGPREIQFYSEVQEFIQKEMIPYYDHWESAGVVPEEIFIKAGRAGILAPDFNFNDIKKDRQQYLKSVVVNEVMSRYGVRGPGFSLHNDVVMFAISEFASDSLKGKYSNKMAMGELIGAIGITEPGGGSDLKGLKCRAEKVNGGFLLNGKKAFIANGTLHNLCIIAAQSHVNKTELGLSLFCVDAKTLGYEHSQPYEKVGLRCRDVVDITLRDVFVSDENLLGKLGQGFLYLERILSAERLSIAIHALASSEEVFNEVLRFIKTRETSGGTLFDQSLTQFALSEIYLKIKSCRQLLDSTISKYIKNEMSFIDAAAVKILCSEANHDVSYAAQQLFGGRGVLIKNRAAKSYIDDRALSIYGGTNEVLKLSIAKLLRTIEGPGYTDS